MSPCLSCLSEIASLNLIEVESDYLLICVCNIRVLCWSSQSSQPGPLGAAVIWVIKIITIIKEIVCIVSMDYFIKSESQRKVYSKAVHFLNNKNQKTPLFTSLVLKNFAFTFWRFAEKSCKHLPPLKDDLKKCTLFFYFISIFKPSFSSLLLCKFNQITILQNPCQLHSYAPYLYIIWMWTERQRLQHGRTWLGL